MYNSESDHRTPRPYLITETSFKDLPCRELISLLLADLVCQIETATLQ